MIKKSCPYCESVQGVTEIKRKESIEYKGKKVDFEAIHYECCYCHEIFDSAEMMNQNLLAVKEAYDAQYNPISPKRIVEIREKYNASQKAFSLILGMGELTINSYEQEKSVPTTTNRLLIHLAENPLIFFEIYEKNKSKIGAIQREKIESSESISYCKRLGGLGKIYKKLIRENRDVVSNRSYSSDGAGFHATTSIERVGKFKDKFDSYDTVHEIKIESNDVTTTENLSIGVA